MIYTTPQLQAMSDKDINSALIKKLGIPHKVDKLGVFIDHEFEDGAVYYTFVDYCNNPNDIMPLAFERRLSLIDCVNEYVCTDDAYGYHKSSSEDFNANGGFRYVHANPLRAIACLLLMMEE